MFEIYINELYSYLYLRIIYIYTPEVQNAHKQEQNARMTGITCACLGAVAVPRPRRLQSGVILRLRRSWLCSSDLPSNADMKADKTKAGAQERRECTSSRRYPAEPQS